MGKFGELPTKLKVTFALTWLSVIFAIALICSGAKAWLYEFPEGAGTTTDSASASSHKNTTLRWGVGPAIVVVLSSLLGTMGVLKRSRPLMGVFTVSTFLCIILSLAGFAVPMQEGSWRSFSDSCKCVEDKCCNLGALCTGEWHKTAYNCEKSEGGRSAALNCPAGQYRGSLETECAACNYGTYKTDALDGCCTACPSMQMTAEKGATSAAACSTCAAACPTGQSSAGGSCAACPVNFYKDCPANSGTCAGCCTVCPAGTVSLPDRSACAPPNSCPLGEYQPVSLAGNLLAGSCRSTNSCAACPAGKYGAIINSFGFCQPCPKGKYQPLAAATACTKCPAGFFSDSLIRNSVCKGCARGRYSGPDSSSCKGCSSGKTSPVLSTSKSACVAVTTRRGRLLQGAAADAAALAAGAARMRSASAAESAPSGSALMGGGPRQWHAHAARALAANGTSGTVGELEKNCNADPTAIKCCFNTEHSTFCDNFLKALNTVIYLNLVNALLLLLLFLIAINSCRERDLYKTQLGPPKKEGEGDAEAAPEEAAPAAAEAAPAAEPSKAVTKKGSKKGGKKAKVVL